MAGESTFYSERTPAPHLHALHSPRDGHLHSLFRRCVHRYQAEVALLNRTVTFRGHISGNDTADGYGGHTRVSGRGSTGHFAGVRAIHMGQTSVLGRYPFHFHLIDFDPEYSGRVEIGGPGATLLGGGWANLTVPSQYTHMLGGTDGTFSYSSSPRAGVLLQATVQTSGRYEILLSKPVDTFEITRLEYWNQHGLSRNVSLEVQQAGGTIHTSTLNFSTHDPIDVHKQWALALRLNLTAGAVNVTVRMEDALGRTRTLALDAVWIREDPSERFVLEDSVITDSFFRCISIHGTNNVRVSRNVAYSIQGNCYYLEGETAPV